MSITDSSPKPKNVILHNGATVSSLRSRFGGSSLYLKNGAYASVAGHTDFGFGNGDFTIEVWIYANDNGYNATDGVWRTLFRIGTNQNGILWKMGTSGLCINNLCYSWNSGQILPNTWNHLALVRNNGTVRVFINGVQSFSVNNSADLGASQPLFIGGNHNTQLSNPAAETFSGYMDEIRITKGINGARYTSNFNVKSLYAPFPSSGTPVSPPNSPMDLSADPLNQIINLLWNPPIEDNGGIITDYNIQYSTDGSTWTDFPHAASVGTGISITGLTNGTSYDVRVGAVNYTGIGNYVGLSNIIPSAGPVDTDADPYFYSTSLLLHFDGPHETTTIVDSSHLPKTPTVQGDAKISVFENKFGGSSLSLDGDGDYLSYTTHPGLDFNTEDFTIEFWAYCKNQSLTYPTYITNREASFSIRFDSGGNQRFEVYWDSEEPLINSNVFSFNQWRHIAVTRQGTVVSLYIDGVRRGWGLIPSSKRLNLCAGGSMIIGNSLRWIQLGWEWWNYGWATDGYVNDFIDDLRITRGVCRYPNGASFTVPTLPFSNTPPSITIPEAPPSIAAFGGDGLAEISFSAPPSDKVIPVSYNIEYADSSNPGSWTPVSSSPTRLLLHFNDGDTRVNTTLKDYSLYNRNILWNTNNNPAFIGREPEVPDYGAFYKKKFAGEWLEVSGVESPFPYVIKVDESSDLNPGTDDYTLEMFVNFTDVSTTSGRLFGCYNGTGGSYWSFSRAGYWLDPVLSKFVNGSMVYQKVLSFSSDSTDNGLSCQMQHLVFCRHNGVMRIYLDGKKIFEIADTNDDNFSNGGLVIMGGESGSHQPNNCVIGRLDELRYTVGEALYADNNINIVPSSEFRNTKITDLSNNQNYIFRIRSQNSAGYSDYTTGSQVLVAAAPEIAIIQQPLNNRVVSWNESASFSVIASTVDNLPLTYQWQNYTRDGCSRPYWKNINNATSNTLNTFFYDVANFDSYNSISGPALVRCLIRYGDFVVSSNMARLVLWPSNSSIQGGPSELNNHIDSFGENPVKKVYCVNPNGDLFINIHQYIFSDLGNNWYTGNDTRIVLQYSTDQIDWYDSDSYVDIRVRDISYEAYPVTMTAENKTGRVYYRIKMIDLWPYTTNDGTDSTSEPTYGVVISDIFAIQYFSEIPDAPTNVVAKPKTASLLLHFDGANGSTSFIDSGSITPRSVSRYGNTQISTDQSPFSGGTSAYFDGDGDYLLCFRSGDNNDLMFETKDFTIETWIRPTSTNKLQTIIDLNYLILGISSTGELFWSEPPNGNEYLPLRMAGTIVPNEWSHVAWSRQNGTNRLFINGVLVDSYTNLFNWTYDPYTITIGRSYYGVGQQAGYFEGHIDELRIVKNIAIYTDEAGFTVPSEPLQSAFQSAEVSWSANASCSLAIDSYSVEYSSDGGSSWAVFGTTTNKFITIPELTIGNSYIFRISASSTAGTSSYSTPSSSIVIV